jgi:hypothetical protein
MELDDGNAIVLDNKLYEFLIGGNISKGHDGSIYLIIILEVYFTLRSYTRY